MDSVSPTRVSKPTKVSALHTLERVRNNQRHHRARRKAYIEMLEIKLSGAEKTIVRLEEQIRVLRHELSYCRSDDLSHCGRLSSPAAADFATTSVPSLSVVHNMPLQLTDPPLDPLTLSRPADRVSALPIFEGSTLGVPTPLASSWTTTTAVPSQYMGLGGHVSLTPTTPSPAFTTWAEDIDVTSSGQAATVPHCSYNSNASPQPLVQANNPSNFAIQDPLLEEASDISVHFPAGTGDESTILCSEAYVLIAQQNSKGVSQEEVTALLWSGFRKSSQPGWGCRVRTDVLFGLLAVIKDP